MREATSQVVWRPPHWSDGSSDDFEVCVDWTARATCRSLGEALAAAEALAERVLVRVEGLGQWRWPVSVKQRAEIDAYIVAARERNARERRSYAPAVEWFVGFLEPDAEDLVQVAELVVGAQHVTSARVHRRTHMGRRERWLILRVLSRDKQEAASVASAAVIRVIWPPERRDRRWVVTPGHTVVGLAEYEDQEFG